MFHMLFFCIFMTEKCRACFEYNQSHDKLFRMSSSILETLYVYMYIARINCCDLWYHSNSFLSWSFIYSYCSVISFQVNTYYNFWKFVCSTYYYLPWLLTYYLCYYTTIALSKSTIFGQILIKTTKPKTGWGIKPFPKYGKPDVLCTVQLITCIRMLCDYISSIQIFLQYS